MIALDASAFATFLANPSAPASAAVARAVNARTAIFPPVVVTELLSNPVLTSRDAALVFATPMLSILDDGYWERAGQLRAVLLRRKLRAGLGDCLIAQSCIDHDIPLITYDLDFRHFEPAGLKLA